MNWVLAYGDVVDEVVEVVVDSYPVCHVDSSQWSDVVRDTNDMVLPKWITIASDEFEGDGEVIVIETNYRQEVWGWCLIKNLRYLAPWSDVGIDCGERNLELSMLNTKPYWNLVIQCSGSIWKTWKLSRGVPLAGDLVAHDRSMGVQRMRAFMGRDKLSESAQVDSSDHRMLGVRRSCCYSSKFKLWFIKLQVRIRRHAWVDSNMVWLFADYSTLRLGPPFRPCHVMEEVIRSKPSETSWFMCVVFGLKRQLWILSKPMYSWACRCPFELLFLFCCFIYVYRDYYRWQM